MDNAKDFKDISDEIRVRLEPKGVERFLVFKINLKALTPTKIEGRTYICAIHGEQECFIRDRNTLQVTMISIDLFKTDGRFARGMRNTKIIYSAIRYVEQKELLK
ncbi:hypothetical protein JT156_03035 [Helicobacter pylori]|nr:hypothetical protein [Helicobacter pylori]